MTATVVCVIPLFATGVLGVQLMDALGFGAVGLGIAVASFRLSGAVFANYLGRLTDRLGATKALRLGVLIAGVVGIATAVFSRNLWTLALLLAMAGPAQVLAQPAANRMLIRRIAPSRQGFAFGVKQAAQPTATMLAGISVPLIALTFGWRWVYASVAPLALIVFFSIRPGPPAPAVSVASTTKETGPNPTRRITVTVMIGFGLAMSASASVSAFFVPAAVYADTPPSLAATVFAAASVASIAARIAAGLVCDRMVGGQMRLAAGLVGGGSIGLALLAFGTPTAMVVGIFVALACGWGFNGVLWYSLMRAYPHVPGRVSGAVNPGGLIGGIIGPIAFGFVVEQTDYSTGWAIMSVIAIIGSAILFRSARQLPSTAST